MNNSPRDKIAEAAESLLSEIATPSRWRGASKSAPVQRFADKILGIIHGDAKPVGFLLRWAGRPHWQYHPREDGEVCRLQCEEMNGWEDPCGNRYEAKLVFTAPPPPVVTSDQVEGWLRPDSIRLRMGELTDDQVVLIQHAIRWVVNDSGIQVESEGE